MEHQVELFHYNQTPMKKGDSQWFINSVDEGRWEKKGTSTHCTSIMYSQPLSLVSGHPPPPEGLNRTERHEKVR